MSAENEAAVKADAPPDAPPPPIDETKTLAEQVSQNETEMYHRTQAHMQEIEEEVRNTQVLVSQKEAIDRLVAEYDPAVSPKFFEKAQELAQKYTHIRRIRGDGNCFYRAVLVAELERIFNDRPELDRFFELCKSWRSRMIQFGMPELTTGDFCDAIEEVLEEIKNGTKNMDFLQDDLNNDGYANYLVAFCRMVTSAYLRENEAIYSGFIEGERDLHTYCQEEIEAMWKDSDHLAIIALVNALGVSVRIEYMDQTQAPNGGWHHDVGEGAPQMFFLYRPGHYDVLYAKKN
ncbi:Ubiquitin thioesterase [Aphelenchoides fujianensis]|nr:Ubiquitin thioesterase [Aphelenchoides fujianensis]